MRLPRMRLTTSVMTAAAFLTLYGPDEALACSGPGAARRILRAELLGLGLLGLSGLLVLAGSALLRRRGQKRRAVCLFGLLPLHPR